MQKSMPKKYRKLMHKWSKNEAKIDELLMIFWTSSERRFWVNLILTKEKPRFFKIDGSKNQNQIDKKSINNHAKMILEKVMQ